MGEAEIPVAIDGEHLTPHLNYRLECCDPRVEAVMLGTIGDGGMGEKPMLMPDSMNIPQLFADSDAEQALALGLDTDATLECMARHFSFFGRFLQLWPVVWEERGS